MPGEPRDSAPSVAGRPTTPPAGDVPVVPAPAQTTIKDTTPATTTSPSLSPGAAGGVEAHSPSVQSPPVPQGEGAPQIAKPASPAAEATPAQSEQDSSGLSWLIDFAIGALLVGAIVAGVVSLWRRIQDHERLVRRLAKKLGLDPEKTDVASLEAYVAQLNDRRLEAVRELDRVRTELQWTINERAKPEEPSPEPVAVAESADEPLSRRRQMLSNMAEYWISSIEQVAGDLLEDAEFVGYFEKLGLSSGAARAAQALIRCRDAEPGAYPEAMYNALARGDFDAALTSLDVLAAYARPERDWLWFLVSLEAAEALLTLSLLECGIRLQRPRLMTPTDPIELENKASERQDFRRLWQLSSAKRAALAQTMALGDQGKVLILDCFSPGWESERFGRRVAWVVLFDPTSMAGDAL